MFTLSERATELQKELKTLATDLHDLGTKFDDLYIRKTKCRKRDKEEFQDVVMAEKVALKGCSARGFRDPDILLEELVAYVDDNMRNLSLPAVYNKLTALKKALRIGNRF